MSEESPNTRISPQTQPSLHEQIADAVRTVRETTPLAQSFTNFVTINLVANAQLAAGGELRVGDKVDGDEIGEGLCQRRSLAYRAHRVRYLLVQ